MNHIVVYHVIQGGANLEIQFMVLKFNNILPQISPLLEDENALDENYVRANLFSSLASRHFRNQLSYYNEYFSVFKTLAEETWTGLRIVELVKSSKKYKLLSLFYWSKKVAMSLKLA